MQLALRCKASCKHSPTGGRVCESSNIRRTMLLLFLLLCAAGGHGARILGIFPTASLSHQLPYQVVMKAMAARGHHVTVISPNPLKTPVANYTDIDLSEMYKYWKSTFDFTAMDTMSPIQSVIQVFTPGMEKLAELELAHPAVQALIRSEAKFDLVVIELLMYQAFYGLVHHVGSPPLVGILSLGGLIPSFDSLGNPCHPAVIPDIFTPYSDHMSFWQRLHNTYVTTLLRYHWHTEVLPGQERLMRKFFGSAPPPVAETEHNISLLLLNNHWSLNYPRPLLPNVVELTGLHVKTESAPLPKDVQQFLDGAEHGAVYFSLGTNVLSSTMPEEKRRAILAVLSRLKQRVLWKWEADSLPEQPANVMTRKWLPQQDLLSHPNIRLFITQGGLQSFQEAAYHAVPLLGIPFIGDQQHNVGKFVAAEIGERLEFRDLTEETFERAIRAVLENNTYRDNMVRFSRVFREHAATSLPRAVWWMEYVLRHDGARHLRSSALDLAWYQYLLLDVLAVVSAALLAVALITFLMFRKLFCLLSHLVSGKAKQKKN